MSTVPVAEDFRAFQEFAAQAHLLKRLATDEMIIFALALGASRPARGARDRKAYSGDYGQQALDQRRFPRTGRRRNNKNNAHSRLSDCSRIFSMSALAASASSVMRSPISPTPVVLERMVLLSRF